MKFRFILFSLVFAMAQLARAQSTQEQVGPILEGQLQSHDLVTFQLQEFLMGKVPKLPAPASAEGWTIEQARIRKRLLEGVVFHGWPQEWVNAPPRFEDLGLIPGGKGYSRRKLRYEIVPGFYSTAILYAPAELRGKSPAVLNVMGHYGPIGKADDSQQTLCINEALRGMMALHLEWPGMGELTEADDSHGFGGHLDLVGVNGEGFFYLAMRRGLDYLWEHPNVDRTRIAVTGLSGGGWQTIVLSSLDARVNVSIPVAGFTSLEGKIAMPLTDPGDIEQSATDFLVGQDYSTLAAMRAPRPTLLVYNAEDNCCFRAPMVKPFVYDAVKPFFQLYGKGDDLQFYENTDILSHQYELSNRRQAYRFFAQYFGLHMDDQEIPVGADLKSYSELEVGLPKDNLTILGLARNLAGAIQRASLPPGPAEKAAWTESQRAKLKDVVRFNPVTVSQAWAVANTKHNAVESVGFRFLFSNGLSATGVWLKNIPTPPGAPLTIILNDKGKKAVATAKRDRNNEVADRMDRNDQVLALDLLFTGDSAPGGDPYIFPEMLAATGQRPIGMEAAQLIAITEWARARWQNPSVRIQSTGIRSQVASLLASALKPQIYSEVVVREGMRSLGYLLDKPVPYEEAADLFCLDLFKEFDLSQLITLSEPTIVHEENYQEDQRRLNSSARSQGQR